MSIDGIGKPPGANSGGVPSVSGAEAARPAEPFSVEPARAGAASAGSRVSAALESVQRGELSLDQYLDGRVTEATHHLAGKLSPDQLDFVKQSLREQLATDPVLVELVQRTTGTAAASELR
ncbi:MAG: hypothetical protein ABW061_22250 [Polyangiaceae bacterium]